MWTVYLPLSLDVLQKRPSTPTLKHFTINYLESHTKSFDYCLQVLTTLEKQIREEIRKLGGNAMLEKIIDALSVERLKEAKPRTADLK
jgi:geranylgeranyl diphosphate synthase type 3